MISTGFFIRFLFFVLNCVGKVEERGREERRKEMVCRRLCVCFFLPVFLPIFLISLLLLFSFSLPFPLFL